MGYDVPNFIFFDKLLNGLTKSWSSFIKDHMDHAAKDDNTPPMKDDILSLCKDILHRLPLNDISNATGYVKDAARDEKNKKNNKNKKKCTHCKQNGHEEPYCWFAHPEKRPAD
ncbi:hypothetical protein AJ78_08780 [Emergomyces pasteurianus Ep9510]|uniref:Uncharacterized protein n=1 Tax=Emergomyces pasteurianus Ep9510 TaxID=1447872 RepID=A0A1J9NZQ1_9EURO|nr:hypothetical protein AJ78_08780 [Emergomyces pasteurianus Ep9510]